MRRPLGRSQSCGRVVRQQVLVGDHVGRGEAMRDVEAAAELAHVGDHLVRGGEALVGAEDGDAASVQRERERLGVGDDGGHVLRPELEQLGRGGGERGDAVDLVGGGERGEDRVQQRRRELEVVPHHHARLRAGERLARAAGEHRGALAQRVLELAAGDQAELVRAVEEDLPAPLLRRCPRSRARGAGTGSWSRRARSASGALAWPPARRLRGRPRARSVSNGTSTMFRPRMPAGPSWRLLEWPPTGCGIVITVSPGCVSAA